MPNWTSNSLTVTGLEADRFLADIESAVEYDFISHLIPMPEEIASISSGSMTIDGERVNHWREVDGRCVKVTNLDRQHLTDVHGTFDWYKWAQAHWGTKWSASDVKVDGNRIYFDTAWSPPRAAIETISKMYPDAVFRLAYAEGGSGFWGLAIYADGDLIGEEESSDFWDPTTDADADDDGYPYSALQPDCRAHIEAYGLHCGG